MDFRFRVRCQANYFGSNCATLCVAQDSNTLGHFMCDDQGNRVCIDGYMGEDCLTRECNGGRVGGLPYTWV